MINNRQVVIKSITKLLVKIFLKKYKYSFIENNLPVIFSITIFDFFLL